MVKDVFSFTECQEKDTFGSVYRLTLTRNYDSSVLKNVDATNLGKIKIKAIE